jgi:hypothetical protein
MSTAEWRARARIDPLIPEARRRQRRRQVAILALLAIAVAAILSSLLLLRGGDPAGGVSSRPATRAPLYAILSSNHGKTVRTSGGSYATLPAPARIVRLDPQTLRPEQGALAIGRFGGGTFVSPDRTRAALASHGNLRLVDLRRLRIERTVTLGPARDTMIRDVAWVGPHRLFAMVQQQSLPYFRNVLERRLVLIDVSTGRVLRRWPLTNKLALDGSGAAAGRYALVLRNSSLKGSSIRLVVATPAGLRTATIGVGKSHGAVRQTTFTIEPDGRRAFLFLSGGSIFTVDLRTLRVARHHLAPLATAWAVSGIPAGKRTLVVSGSTATGSTLLGSGVYVVDTGTWSTRLLDRNATWATYANGVVLTSGPAGAIRPWQSRGYGVSAFKLDGTKLYHVLGNRAVYVVSAPGRRVLAFRPLGRGLSNRQQWIAFDLRTGKNLVAVARTGSTTILG